MLIPLPEEKGKKKKQNKQENTNLKTGTKVRKTISGAGRKLVWVYLVA